MRSIFETVKVLLCALAFTLILILVPASILGSFWIMILLINIGHVITGIVAGTISMVISIIVSDYMFFNIMRFIDEQLE